MKQILQDLRSGETRVEVVPAPLCRPGSLRIASAASLVSAGTERMLVDFSRGSLLSKARQQPERVAQALHKIRTDGLQSTVAAIRSKLNEPIALGYCNVGRVIEAGAATSGFKPGDRVISNGKHAEITVVPELLCARIPDEVDDEAAAFAVVGAIALQGLRLANPTIGEAFVVTGLGVIGLLAVQLLAANGCRVLGIDRDPYRLELARRFGAETVDLSAGEHPLGRAAAFSRGRGVDGVLLAASTSSDEPVSQAAQMCRKRARIVLIGVTGLKLSRADFYEKELTFQVSCSYGPGRYDPEYEVKGHDYPVGFVRWTERRNFETVLDLMAAGIVDVGPLITHRFALEDAPQAYDLLASAEKSLGILIRYSEKPLAEIEASAERGALDPAPTPRAGRGVAGFVGVGNYGGRVLVGAFQKAGAGLDTIVSGSGVSAARLGRKFGFRHVAADPDTAIGSGEIDTICIATRHDTHAELVLAALAARKHVFVEKPLCLTAAELDEIADRAVGTPSLLMVGFNRRFAPMTVRAKALIDAVAEPKSFVMTVNAGAIPNDHWTQDPAVGGGRIVGEMCHFIDLLRHLAGNSIERFEVAGLNRAGGPPATDTAMMTLKFADGSIGAINYLANGHRAFPKERLEIFCAERVLVLDNFRRLGGFGWPRFRMMRSWRQDKGQEACVAAFMDAVRRGLPSPIPLAEIIEVSRVAIEAAARAG